jgi:hypothetical protein
MSLLKKISFIALLACALGGTAFQAEKMNEQAREIRTLEQRVENDRRNELKVQSERDEALSRINEAPPSAAVEVVPTSGDEVHDEKILALLQRIKRVRQWFDEHPDRRVPELQLLADFEWFTVVGEKASLDSERDLRYTALDLKRRAQMTFLRFLVSAMNSYHRANNGRFPTDIDELIPYLTHPFEAALIHRYVLTASSVASGRPMISEFVPPGPNPPLLETMPIFEADPSGNSTQTMVRIVSFRAEQHAENMAKLNLSARQREVMDAMNRFEADHPLELLKNKEQLLPYVKNPSLLEAITIETTRTADSVGTSVTIKE